MKRLAATAAAAALLALTGCSAFNDQRGWGDAPVGKVDDGPARILNMPDRFANVAHKCMGPNGIYTTTREAAAVVVVNDPLCKRGAA